jgi:hypothetical protein
VLSDTRPCLCRCFTLPGRKVLGSGLLEVLVHDCFYLPIAEDEAAVFGIEYGCYYIHEHLDLDTAA